eukprot:452574-Prorocentrum_minimum.AAC.1
MTWQSDSTSAKRPLLVTWHTHAAKRGRSPATHSFPGRTTTAELTVKTLLSNPITQKLNSPANSSRNVTHVRVEPPSRPPLDPL